MVNLIAGKQIVPELVQHDFTAQNVVSSLKDILADGPARDRMIEALAAVKQELRVSDDGANAPALRPAERAAEIIRLMASRLPKTVDQKTTSEKSNTTLSEP